MVQQPQALIGLVLAGGLLFGGWLSRRSDPKKLAYGPDPTDTPEQRAEYYRRWRDAVQGFGKWTMRLGGLLAIACVIAAFV